MTSVKPVLEKERLGSYKRTVHCREIVRAFSGNKENRKDKVSFNFTGCL